MEEQKWAVSSPKCKLPPSRIGTIHDGGLNSISTRKGCIKLDKFCYNPLTLSNLLHIHFERVLDTHT